MVAAEKLLTTCQEPRELADCRRKTCQETGP
jgi:hypothetical protein